ncbi:MAG: VCBS repeat-containing protein [Thermotogae bacterium]|nr:VCBS repeat-containing protein [Thermotogota bacterium]
MLFLLYYSPFLTPPTWESEAGFYSTGLGAWDFNGDGYVDLVVSNGNDMARQPLAVYNGTYSLPSPIPSRTFGLSQYHGHLALGDVNGDGLMDLVVAGFSGYMDGWNRQVNTLYLNRGDSFSLYPDWVSDSGRCFGVASGDVNGDGLADFLFSCGNDYSSDPEPARLYVSDGITLVGPVWQTRDSIYSLGAKFFDVDNDGDLDLFLGLSPGRHRLYLNHDGVLDTIPAWESDREGFANQIGVADVDNDGFLDVVVANTFQFSPDSSRVELYKNLGGTLETMPSWEIREPGQYFSCVALGDINADGWIELIVGGWWDPVSLFDNFYGSFTTTPSWTWQPPSPMDLVAENLVLTTVNPYVVYRVDTFIISHPAHVVRLRSTPVISVLSVSLDDRPVPFTVSPDVGWLSVPSDSVLSSSRLVVSYLMGGYPDLVVSNWEDSRGNFIFLNRLGVEVYERATFTKNSSAAYYDVAGRRVSPLRKGIIFIVKEGKVRKVLKR